MSFDASADSPKHRRPSSGERHGSTSRSKGRTAKEKRKSKSQCAERGRRASEGDVRGEGGWSEADLEAKLEPTAAEAQPSATAKASSGGWFEATKRLTRATTKRTDGAPDATAANTGGEGAGKASKTKGGSRKGGNGGGNVEGEGSGRLTTPLTASEKARKKSFMAKALRLSGLGSSGGAAAAASQGGGTGAGAWNRAQNSGAAEAGGKRRDSSMRDSFGYRASVDDLAAMNPLQGADGDFDGPGNNGKGSEDPLEVQRAARRVSKQQSLVRAQAEQQLKEQPWMATLYSEEKDAADAERLRSALREHREGAARRAVQEKEQTARSNAEREARERRRLDPEEEAALNHIKVLVRVMAHYCAVISFSIYDLFVTIIQPDYLVLIEEAFQDHRALSARMINSSFNRVLSILQAMRGGGSGMNDSRAKKGRTAALTAAQIKAELKARSSSRSGGGNGSPSGGGGNHNDDDDEFDQVFLAEMHASRRAAELQEKRRALRMKSSSRADRSLGLGGGASPSFLGDDAAAGGGGLFTLDETEGGGDAWGGAGPWAQGASSSSNTKGSEMRSMLPWASSSSKKNKGNSTSGKKKGAAPTHEEIEAHVMEDHNDDASVKAYEATLAKVIVYNVLIICEGKFKSHDCSCF